MNEPELRKSAREPFSSRIFLEKSFNVKKKEVGKVNDKVVVVIIIIVRGQRGKIQRIFMSTAYWRRSRRKCKTGVDF